MVLCTEQIWVFFFLLFFLHLLYHLLPLSLALSVFQLVLLLFCGARVGAGGGAGCSPCGAAWRFLDGLRVNSRVVSVREKGKNQLVFYTTILFYDLMIVFGYSPTLQKYC